MVHHREALGDNYAELVESLNRMADAGKSLSSCRARNASLVSSRGRAMWARHSGKIGDVVYSMSAMKRLHLLVNCKIDVVLDDYNLTDGAMAAVTPLLKSQSYIGDVEFKSSRKCTVDFRDWMLGYNDHRRNTVLSAIEYVVDQSGFNIDMTNPADPWLVLDVPDNQKTLVNVTDRHLNEEEGLRANWSAIIAQNPQAEFIGLAAEHAAFQDKFKVQIPYIATPDLLEAAKIIKGCALFLGNQSSCLAIAHGLGKTVIAESAEENPNCIFEGRGSQYHGVSEKTRADYAIQC